MMHSEKAQKFKATLQKSAILGMLVIGILLIVRLCSGHANQDDRHHQNIAEQWQMLLRTEGCLIGMENWQKGIEKTSDFRQGCVLATPLFQEFIHGDAEVVKPFLFTKLASEYPTAIHVCPHQDAFEGELAWYILQHIAHRNWYEYQGENQFIREQVATRQAIIDQKAPYSPMTTDQQLVRSILNDHESQNALLIWYSE
jgi:hypothetical protein